MRELSPEQFAMVEDLTQSFEEFYPALMQMAGDFAERLRLPDPHLIVEDPAQFVPVIAEVMRTDELPDEDKAWLLPRLAFVIGETLAGRHLDGGWEVDRDPDSPSFGRYIVTGGGEEGIRVDPFAAAADFLDMPTGRDLEGWIESFGTSI